ncbi:MAG: 2'-5' RNA ligase family protein [Oscillospiraceae bacterium]|nr:2'-5' RNA ligase family protein [Oscillospiraceae bacterium]
MAQELMWVCAIVPEEFTKTVVQLCLAENKTIGLPENVFKLPLHISMKKSFYTNSFNAVKADILKTVNGIGAFWCRIDKVNLHQGMLWLSLISDGDLRYLHEELDRLLAVKYNIPVSKYDRVFQPHISLFTRGTREQMGEMYSKLKDRDFGGEIAISRFVIGSSGHRDTFYDLK